MDPRELATEIRDIRRRGHENFGRLLHLLDLLCDAVLDEPTAYPSPEGLKVGESSEQALDQAEKRVRERKTDSWFRELHDGRIEVMCKAPGFRIRVSALEDQAWEAVELFESWTGLTVRSERRPPRRFAPPPGQLTMTELESGDNDGED